MPLAGALLAAAPPAQVPLRAGEAFDDSLEPGAARTYTAVLDAGRTWRIAVEQRGIDVTVEVFGPDDQRLAAVDSPFDRQGTETLVLAPPTGGAYRIAVRGREPGAPPGRFSIRLDALDEPRRAGAEAAMSRAGGRYLEGTAEARRRALEEYSTAAGLWHDLGEPRDEARALYAAAVLARLTGDTPRALELGGQVLPLWQALGDRLWEAATRNEVGLDLWLQGRIEEARASYQSALAIQREIGDRYGEAVSLSNLCAIDLPRGELRAALACYDEALPRLREVQAVALEGSALTSAGRALDVLGEPETALLRYREALALLRSVDDRAGEARVLNNMAVLDREMGELQDALASYGQALQIVSTLEDRRWQARVLHNLGAIYQGLGEPRQALPQYEQALPFWRQAGDREGEAATLTHLGRVHLALGDPRRALTFLDQALERAAGDRRGEGIALGQKGRAQAALGDPAAALTSFEAAIERLHAVGAALDEADAQRGRGLAQAALGETEKALASLDQALAIARAARIPASEVETLCALARTERALGRTEAARAHATEAVAVVESLRTRIGNPDLRATFAATLHQAYELQIDLLLAAGFDRAALEAGERSRARTLLELLGEAGADLRQGIDPALLERRASLERRLNARAERALREREPAARAARLAEQDALLRDLDLLDAEIRERSPAYAALTRPQPVGADEIEALLDPGTLLLSYSLGETRSHLFAVTSHSIETFELPARAPIEQAARRVHEGMSGYHPAGRAAESRDAAELSRMLLGPVADRLAGRRLVVVADGALHYVPFGALPEPSAREDVAPVPLLERHEVVYLPSASALAFQRRRLAARPPAPGKVVVVADPAFAAGDPAFPPLPASRQEAEAIAALAAPGQAWLALGVQASREEVLGNRLAGFRTVHFATHGVLDAEHPALSGLALSTVDGQGQPREGFLPLRDVYGLRLGADLVVLSGCRTALGREIRGEGLSGLTRGFFHAGAARVVASLWRVEDRATAELMTRFYRAMWMEGLPPAAALRSAQLALRGERRLRDPYFWAAFMLQGDWR
jgi:CHAT domain-containing protein/tetratricopeptide (TPR) repeat protein